MKNRVTRSRQIKVVIEVSIYLLLISVQFRLSAAHNLDLGKVGIHLTQVAPTCSMRGHGTLSKEFGRVRSTVRD